MKRQRKFYGKNEKETMKKIGLNPTPQSGSGWIIKEDGENEAIVSQLKSTDAESFRITREDMDKLEYHSLVSHKIPIFVTQFLKDNAIYFTIRLENISDLIEYWQDNESFPKVKSEPLDIIPEPNVKDVKFIKSGNRRKYQEMREKEYEKIGKRKR